MQGPSSSSNSQVIGMDALIKKHRTSQSNAGSQQVIQSSSGGISRQASLSAGQTEVRLVKTLCPQCSKEVEVDMNRLNLHGHFFKETECNLCNKSFCYLPCCCGSVITNPGKILHGSKLKCNNSKCSAAFLQLFMCPVPHCQTINMFQGDYKMGAQVKCCRCAHSFQQIGCPFCKSNIYFAAPGTPYREGAPVQCSACRGVFTHYNCRNCVAPLFLTQPIQPGHATQCYACKKAHIQFLCPNVECKQSIFLSDIKSFKHAKNYKCDSCSHYYQFFKCNKCRHLNSQNLLDCGADFGRRVCSQCKTILIMFECPHCKDLHVQNELSGKDLKYTCSHCKKQFLASICQLCFTSTTQQDTSSSKITCIGCKNDVLILGGGAGTMTVLPQQIQPVYSPTNPSAANSATNTQKNQQQNLNQGTANTASSNAVSEDYLCKICCNEKANHIFKKCGHLVACSSCISSLKNKCPLCRVESDYMKIFI